MKFSSLIVAALFLSLSAQAADPFTLLKCPAVPLAFSKMITELNVIKTAIKRDAACTPLAKEVTSLETLVGERRQGVVDLIDKSKTTPLTDMEQDKVRKYVEDVTKKVFSTAELLDRNSSCFSEDNQSFGLADMASITLDATALAKTVAGPWSVPIAIGGTALASIMQGLDKVVKNNRGYDFEKIEQRQSYVQSLCAYYNYRQDIEYLLYPERRITQLKQLNSALKNNLSGLVNNCDGCKQISELSTSGGDANAINGLIVSTDSAYKLPVGSYTAKTISSLGWANNEIARIATEMEGDPSIGRDFLAETKTSIDGFLFEKEAPRFLDFQNDKTRDLFKEFRAYVMTEAANMFYLAGQDNSMRNTYGLNELQVIAMVSAMKPQLLAKGNSTVAYRIADFERKSMDLLDRTKISSDVQKAYCSFFQRAGLYSYNIAYYCESTMMVNLQAQLAPMEKKVSGGMGLVADQEPTEITADWVDGLTNMVNKISATSNRFQLK